MDNILCLEKLDISHNAITYETVDSIANFLSFNSELKEVALSCSDLNGTDLFERIKTTKLTKLDISVLLILQQFQQMTFQLF